MVVRRFGRMRHWLRALGLGTMLAGVSIAPAEAAPVFGAVAAFAATQLGGIVVNAVIGIAFSFGASLLKNLFGGNNKQKSNLAMRLSVATGGVVPQSFIVGHWATSGSLNYRGSWGEADGTPNAYYVEERVISDLPVTLSGFAYGEQRATILWDEPTDMGFPIVEARRDGIDHLWIRWRNGDDITTADSYMRAKFGDHPTRPYTGDMLGIGRATAIVTRKVPNEDNRDLFPANLEYRFETPGIALYDLSKDSTTGGFGPQRWNDRSSWEPSSNPAVQIYNILRGIYWSQDWLYGLQGLHPSRLPASSWIAAINEANVLTYRADGSSEPQFRTGAEIAVELEPAGVIEKLLAGCSGRMAEIGGIYKILIGAPGAAVMSFTDADIVVTKEQGFSPFPRIEQTYNGVRAKYVEPSAGWELKDAPARYSAEHEAEDGGRRLVADVTLETVSSNTQVQRLVKTAAEEQRRWRRHRNGLAPIASELEPLDVVSWTSGHNGYSDKKFLVTEIEDEPTYLQVLDVQELDPADYDYDANVEERPYSVGDLGIGRPSPQVIIGFSVSPAIIYDSQGQPRRPAVRFGWDGAIEDVRAVAFELRTAATEQLVLSDSTDNVSAGEALVTSAAILPNQQLEGRGKYLPRGPRATEWTGWLPVTTPDIKLSGFDLYEGVIGFEHLQQDLAEYQAWIGDGVRDLVDEAKRIALLTVSQDLSNYNQIQTTKQEIRLSAARVTAAYQHAITVAVGPDSALVQRLEQLEVSVGDDMASAIASLTAMIEATEDSIDMLSMDMVVLGNRLGNDLATATNVLNSRITQVDDRVTSEANRVTALNATVNGISADANFRMSVQAGPSGYSSRLGMEARVGGAGAYRSAGLFIDVPASTSSPTRVAVAADQFVVAPTAGGSTAFRPFIVQGGVVYIDNGRIRNLTGENVDAIRINGIELRQNGRLITDMIADQAVSDMVVQTGFGERGTLVSRGFTVTHGKVFLMGSTFLNRPTDNSANFGNIELSLKHNGIVSKNTRIFYDDNFATGLTIVHEVLLSPGFYNFSFHADNLTGAGQWSMHGGSTLTIMNLKK